MLLLQYELESEYQRTLYMPMIATFAFHLPSNSTTLLVEFIFGFNLILRTNTNYFRKVN